MTKIFCFNVEETELRAIVDSVIIIFKIRNQDIVAMCIMGCGKKKFRNTSLVNNPVCTVRSNKKKSESRRKWCFEPIKASE
jgi:hypothetical protein